VKTSNHGWRTAAKVILVPVAVLIAVSAIADGISKLAGPRVAVVFVLAVPVACWLIFRDRPDRHPAPARRRAPGRDPQDATPLTLTESDEPARLAA
jgi:hypothetical protein